MVGVKIKWFENGFRVEKVPQYYTCSIRVFFG